MSETLPPKMEQLSREGYYFALDDFGSGYSNYDSLMRLPFCAVKLDRMMLTLSLTNKRSETILISPWTRTEFASAAGIMARRGDISADLHREGLERFDRLVSTRLAVEAVDTTDFDRAGSWISDYRSGLRAGDALHLAGCMRLSATLGTADDTLARAADTLGVAVQRVA